MVTRPGFPYLFAVLELQFAEGVMRGQRSSSFLSTWEGWGCPCRNEDEYRFPCGAKLSTAFPSGPQNEHYFPSGN